MDKEFSNKIIVFNFFYSIRVLCYHASAGVYFENIVTGGSLLERGAACLDSFFANSPATYFFMWISAFMLYRNLTPDNMADKLKRRIGTLLVPWLAWNLIGLVSYYHELRKGPWYVLRCFLASRFCEQLWFVQMLMIMLLFIPLIRRIFKVKVLREILLLLLLFLGYRQFPFVAQIPFLSEQSAGEVLRALNHVPIYCVGAYLGLNWPVQFAQEKYLGKYKTPVKLAAAAALVLSFVPGNGLIHYLFFQLRSLAVWVLAEKCFFTHDTAWWMQISFYTYAVHNFFLHWEGKLLKMTGIFAAAWESQEVSAGFALLWRLTFSAVAVVLVMGSAQLLIRFTPGFYRILSGGRLPDGRMGGAG